MRKEFTLKDYFDHPDWKVETRDGRSARIICMDKVDDCEQHIVALVQCTPSYESIISVCENGEYKGSYGHDYDLFLVAPEPELTPFEKGKAEALKDLPKWKRITNNSPMPDLITSDDIILNNYHYILRSELDKLPWED